MPGDEQGSSVPHGVFGGLVTDITPPLTVDGLSPDCQDIVFLVGQWKQREGLRKLFASAFGQNPVYEKTYLQPNEVPLNLFLDAANHLYREDPLNAPGVKTLISTLPATGITNGRSSSAFGREYLAFSDGKHGAHVPLQYDGIYLDRVSQDGPGATPDVSDYSPSYVIAAPGVPGLQMAVTGKPIGTITEAGNVASFQAAFLFNVDVPAVGDSIQISGSSEPGYNGVQTISSKVFNGGLNWTLSFVVGTSGLAAGTGAAMDTTVVIVQTTTANAFAVGLNADISGATVPAYDGAWPVRSVSSSTVFRVTTDQFALANSGDGTATIAGNISQGVHRVVVMFRTRQGYITKPSPVASWTAGIGQVFVDNLPIGPSNVVERIVAFTGTGGDNFFYIPTDFTLPGSTSSVRSTVVLDNTSTSAVFDFSDNALFAATSIDVQGRNYFAQVVLAEVLGFFPYASRLAAWGERNKVQRFLSMGFEGGYLSGDLSTPLGWHVDDIGGTLINGGAWDSGMAWQITTATGSGQIAQNAYQNELGLSILDPQTQYTARLWAKKDAANTGNIVVAFYSLSSGGVLSAATIPFSAISTVGGFVEADFSVKTSVVIPSDLQILVYTSGVLAPTVITLDELNVIFTENPYRDALFRWSYINAPEQFDGETGENGSTSDFTPIRNCFQLRNVMDVNTEIGKYSMTDNGTGEPSTWSVLSVTQTVGSLSVNGTDTGRVGSGESGEQWEFTISEQGVYVFGGGEDFKISQEIQKPTMNGFPGWDSINQAAIASAWCKNDTTNRRLYIGVPTGTATAPNVVFVLDYRGLESAWSIANTPPYKSVGGRVLALEVARKWTRWSLSLNTAEILCRARDDYRMTFGAGNGVTPGTDPGFGNVYSLDETLLTDDDYGQFTPYRTSHFFPSDDARGQYRLGQHRVLASYLSLYVSGTGQTAITPLVNTLTNPQEDLPPYGLNDPANFDFEWDVNVTGERIAWKVGVAPNTGETDNAISVQSLVVTLKKDPWSPIRGTILA